MALNDEKQDRLYEVITERVSDTNAPDGLDLGSALARLLVITRRIERRLMNSAARENRLIAAVEALAESSEANQTEVMAAVNAALEAITELDDDLPEGEEPTLASITPAEGPTAGGTPVTLAGTGFAGATGFTVGGVAASEFVVVSATAITGTTPAGTEGAADVVVNSTEGSATLVGGFTYTA